MISCLIADAPASNIVYWFYNDQAHAGIDHLMDRYLFLHWIEWTKKKRNDDSNNNINRKSIHLIFTGDSDLRLWNSLIKMAKPLSEVRDIYFATVKNLNSL